MLKNLFKYQFEGIIWKLIPNEKRRSLLFEIRTQIDQNVYFYELKMNDLSLNKIQNLNQNWWFGLQETSDDFAIFQVYNHLQMPASKALISYQLDNKNIAWQLDELTFHHLSSDHIAVLVQHDEKTEIEYLELKTGKKNLNFIPTVNQSIINKNIYPFHYKNDNHYFADIATFILEKQKHIAVEAIDYLEVGQLILFSYYICNPENKLNNYLLVINSKGELVLSETLGENLNGIGIDTFWISENQLIFIENKKVLNIFSIEEQ